MGARTGCRVSPGEGCEVLEASNAHQTIDVVDRCDRRIVFSDVTMPGELDGIGLVRWVRVHHPDVPVLKCGNSPMPGIFGSAMLG